MSPITVQLGLLALASTALAVPLDSAVKFVKHQHGHFQPPTQSTAATTEAATSAVATTVASTVAAASSATSTTTSVAAQSTATSGKRGVAYNTASLCSAFEGQAEVTWGYNWGSASGGLASSFNYVPLLWGTSSSFTDYWASNAQAAIDAGSTYLMSFNEPDLDTQSNLTPAQAASAYMTYMQPFAGKVKLGAPAVTNGGGAMGLTWLSEFLDACTECTIDFVPIHWYDSYSNTAYFQEQVANATAVAGGKPVWVTEFGCTDGTDAQIAGFLETVMPWMDAQSYVERYSYFMVEDGLLLSGTALSTYGSTFASFT